jgi:hypothetical protein
VHHPLGKKKFFNAIPKVLEIENIPKTTIPVTEKFSKAMVLTE